MASVTIFHGPDKLIFFDTGHPHGKYRADEIHVHELDLSKITLAQLEELESQSRNGMIEYHTWKRIPGAMKDRDPYPYEIDVIKHELGL